MQLKANASKIVRRGDGQEGTLWQYTVGYPVEESLKEGYFNSVVHNVLIGDEIRMVRKEQNRITEVLDLIVVEREMTPPLVVMAAISDVVKIPLPPSEADEPVVIPDEVFVPEDCKTKWKVGSRSYDIIGTSGTTYASGIEDGDFAKQIACGDMPIPVKEAA